MLTKGGDNGTKNIFKDFEKMKRFNYQNANKDKLKFIENIIVNKLYLGLNSLLDQKNNQEIEIDNKSMSKDETTNIKFIMSKLINDSTNNLQNSLIEKLDNTISDDLKEYINLKYSSLEKMKNNDVIYTINYKNNPLFLLKDTSDKFSLNDSEYSRIIKKLASFNENNLLSTNLINISNNVKFEKSLTGNFLYLMQNNNQVNAKNNYLSLQTNKNNLKINIDKQLSDFHIFENNLISSLNQNKKDNKKVLQNKYGILQSIYYYNKNLANLEQTDLNQDLLVNNANDIIILWSQDQTLEPSYYGEILGNINNFNCSLNNSYKHTTYDSLEELNHAKKTILQLQPIQIYLIKDHFNNIINYQTFDPNKFDKVNKVISDGYGTNEEIAYQNTLNKIVLYADVDYIFYQEKLIKNEINKLYSLTFTKCLTNSENNFTYTFTKYKNMYSYLYDYIKLNAINIY